jgi:nucleoside-diphosphate-sugar epimerase/predicted dehydrogenase
MKIGLVGCGQIARVHAAFIQQSKGHHIVGVCDADLGRANAFAQACRVDGVFGSLQQLVDERRPDVIHIVTPPQSHAHLAMEAMQAGCHVLVEKPMALTDTEAESMIAASRTYGRKLCVDHNQLFDPVVLRARELIRQGVLGAVIDVQSYYGFNLAQVSERRWVETLPGGAFQNLMPHPLYLMLEFLGDPLEIHVSTLDTGALGPRVPDELRVLLKGKEALGTLSISLAIKPHLNFLRISGSKAIVHADLANMILSMERLRPLPKALARGLLNIEQGNQIASGAILNAVKFVLGTLKPYQGLGNLIRAFYESIESDREPPVPGEAGRLVVQTFERIRAQLPPIESTPQPRAQVKAQRPHVLVTGATGFVGSHLVEKLVQRGVGVRALVRPTSRIGPLRSLDIDWVDGDLGDVEKLKKALDGTEIVYHCAATTKGTWWDYLEGTIRGTERLLTAASSVGVRRLVHISSLSVYAVSQFADHERITEDMPLEPHPEQRGHYTQSKVEAEKLVVAHAKDTGLPVTILRPGTIYGPGGKIFFPRIGYSFKNRLFLILGNGTHPLPLTYVENVADAICLAGSHPEAVGQIYNIVDNEEITQREYVVELIRRLHLRALTLRVPFSFLSVMVTLLEAGAHLTNGKYSPPLTRYRLVSNTRHLYYDTSRATTQLQWRPAIPLSEGLQRTFEWYRSVRMGN